MALMTEIRKNVSESTPIMAVVGATDYAVERFRAAAANAGHLQEELERALAQLEHLPKEWQARMKAIDTKAVQQAPVLVVHRAMELAGRVEESYGRLAERGRELIDRATHTAPAQELVKQGQATLTRSRAAVTSARKAFDDTTAAAWGVVSIGRREAVEAAADIEAQVEEGVEVTETAVVEHTKATKVAVKDAAATVRKRAAATRKATRSAAKSVRKTAKTAVEAVEAAAAEVGEASAEAPVEPATPVAVVPSGD